MKNWFLHFVGEFRRELGNKTEESPILREFWGSLGQLSPDEIFIVKYVVSQKGDIPRFVGFLIQIGSELNMFICFSTITGTLYIKCSCGTTDEILLPFPDQTSAQKLFFEAIDAFFKASTPHR
ncbi:MAG: hypothetical protein V1848_01490 [Candidatus Magasanikbacteria bacterium]